MGDMETPSNTAVIKITENSETALHNTEVMSATSKSIKDCKEITSDLHLESMNSSMQLLFKEGSVHSMASMTSIKSMNEKSISLVKKGSLHSMISITLKDEKSIQDDQNDQDDQDDQDDQEDQENQEDQGDQEDKGDQNDHQEDQGQETEMKKQKAKMKRQHEYICIILSTFIFMIIPFIWYHLEREEKGDFILPGQTYNQADDMKSNDSCPFMYIIGDNYCDDEANIPECGYDLNDCCKVDRDVSLCTDCFCYIPEHKKIMLEEKFNNECTNYITNYITWTTYFGDGQCDLGFNSKEYFFDIGDCCQENPTCMSSTFESIKYEFCPENVCIESNIFCVEEELGDGICQGYNNGPLCDHDLGDCCLATGSQTNFTCNSECFLDCYYQLPYFIG